MRKGGHLPEVMIRRITLHEGGVRSFAIRCLGLKVEIVLFDTWLYL